MSSKLTITAPFYLSKPLEHIRKPSGFMLSRGTDHQHEDVMG